MFDILRADMRAGSLSRRPDLKSGLWKEDLRTFLQLSSWPIISFRFTRWAMAVRIPVLRQALVAAAALSRIFTRLFTGITIHAGAEIGPGLMIHSLYAINVGATKIGKNCTVQSGVLIGAGCRGIGDNVYFGAGAKIIGDTKIGNNVVIVANSLVLTDVADNTTIVGVPARIKLRGGRPQKFPPKPPAAS
jgi:serine O-acetyltransferase